MDDEHFSVVSVALFTSVAVETDKLFHIVGVLVENAVVIFWLTLASAIVAKNSKAAVSVASLGWHYFKPPHGPKWSHRG